MDLEQAIELVNTVMFARFGRCLNDVETAVFTGSWQSQTYEQIAETSGYSVSYIRKHIGAQFWKLLSEALGESVSKTNFRAALERLGKQSAGHRNPVAEGQSAPEFLGFNAESRSSVQRPVLRPSPSTLRVDWGEAIDVSIFYGRTDKLQTLTRWILTDRCRLIALLGMGGIGKSSLATKVAQQLQDQFEYVIWRSLRNAPLLEALLADLMLFFSEQQDPRAELNPLLHHLRSHRCLIILDNVETILQSGDRAGQYLPGYESYGELIRLIGEMPHQSCLLFTSREKTTEIFALEGVELPVRSLLLDGCPDAAQATITAKGLWGTAEQKQWLCHLYDNNPLAIKLVTTFIQDLFDGDINEFLTHETALFNGIRRLLDQQFSRLSPLEQSIMYWLAVNREWTTVAELHQDTLFAVSKAMLLEALETLNWRNLIIKKIGSYTQQPLIMEYVTERLIDQIATELKTAELNAFLGYALLKTTVKDYVRQSQSRLIMQPIVAQFREMFGSMAALEQQVLRILMMLRRSETKRSGYGAGNLINFCCHLGLDLTGFNFSNLTIRHAYLKVNLHRVNFANSELSHCVFTHSFGSILSIAFSLEGSLLATGDTNGRVNLWQIEDGQPLLSCQERTNSVLSVAFSPSEPLLASGSEDGSIRLWDTCIGQRIYLLQGHSSWVTSIAFSRSGQFLISGSADCTIRLWDMATKQCLRVLQGHTHQVWSVCFSPDEQILASSSEDGTVRLWDVQTGQCLKTLKHKTWTRSVAFSANGQLLASGGGDNTVWIWDVQTGQCLKTLQGHQDWIWSVAFHPHEQILASGSADQAIRLWDVNSGQCLRVLQGHTNWVWSVAFHPNGQTLASGSEDCTVHLWQLETGHCLTILHGYTIAIHSIAVSPSVPLLASGNADGTVQLWSTATNQCLKTLYGHTNIVRSVAFSPDGQWVASAGEDLTVRVWEVQTAQCLKTLYGHIDLIRCVSFSPDGRYLASGSDEPAIYLWDVVLGECLEILRGHQNWVWSIAFSPDGSVLVSASEDQTIRLWDIHTRQCLHILQGHEGAVRSVAFSPNGDRVASASEDQTVRLWDVQTRQCTHVLHDHLSQVRSVAFSPIDPILASCSADWTIKLWDVRTSECLRTLQGHTSQVRSVNFSPEGHTLVSSDEDGTIKLWDINTGQCLTNLRANRPYEGMNITGITGVTEAQKAALRFLGASG